MKNKLAIVTGASSGVGLEIASEFLESGAHVVVCARRQELLEQKFEAYDKAIIRKLDVTSEKEIAGLVYEIIRDYERIDVLVNNAAVLHSGMVEEIDVSQWRESYQVNVEAPFIFCKYVLPHMKERDYGRIINMSSGGAVNCAPEYSLYSSTKAALNAFSRSLSRELEGTNVIVNMMSPGPCRTEMFPDSPLDPKLAVPTAKMLAQLPKGGPSGEFFWFERKVDVFPDLSSINWAEPSSFEGN